MSTWEEILQNARNRANQRRGTALPPGNDMPQSLSMTDVQPVVQNAASQPVSTAGVQPVAPNAEVVQPVAPANPVADHAPHGAGTDELDSGARGSSSIRASIVFVLAVALFLLCASYLVAIAMSIVAWAYDHGEIFFSTFNDGNSTLVMPSRYELQSSKCSKCICMDPDWKPSADATTVVDTLSAVAKTALKTTFDVTVSIMYVLIDTE
jgi:hypothetical protein